MNFSSATSLAAVGLLLCPVITYGQAGTPIWTNRYTSLGNNADDCLAIAVDSNATVYVTGESYEPYLSIYAEGCRTIAYSSSGEQLWNYWYSSGPITDIDNAYALAVGKNGDIYTTGDSAAYTADYETIAYSSSGDMLWKRLYNGPGYYEDYASAIAVSPNGHVLVTGYSSSVVSNSDYPDSYYDYATIAYSSSGVPLWTNRYNGPGNNEDEATAIAVGRTGNVYVTGKSFMNAWFDYATVAYSSAGAPLWTNRYDNGDDYATAIAVDSNDNVYVTGASTRSDSLHGDNYDYATIAYSSTGMPLWTNRYNGPAYLDDKPNAIAIGSNGNVYVTGESYGNNFDFATIAYSSEGIPLWTNRYNGPGDNIDDATAIAVDSNGNVYVTGYSYSGTSYNSADFATIAYSSTGSPLWTNRYNGPGSGYDVARAIAVDSENNVYVAGSSWANDSDYDYTIIKYGSMLSNLPILLHSQIIGNQIVLNWTNSAFSLQSAPKVEGVYTNVSVAVSPYTNDSSKPQRFFRLIEN